MAIYSLATSAAVGVNGTALWEIRTTSTDQANLVEIGFANGTDITPSAEQLAIGTPAARGVTPTSPVTFLGEDPGSPTGTVQAATAWGTGPTAPANFLRRQRDFHFMYVVWTFPRGFLMAVSSSFVLWTVTGGTSVTQQFWAAVDE